MKDNLNRGIIMKLKRRQTGKTKVVAVMVGHHLLIEEVKRNKKMVLGVYVGIDGFQDFIVEFLNNRDYLLTNKSSFTWGGRLKN